MRTKVAAAAAALLLAAMCCQPTQAQVAHDASGTALCSTNTTPPLTCTTLTVGSGANRVLTVFVSYNSTAAISSSTVTWDGVSMGEPIVDVFSAGNFIGAAIYCLANPVSGNQTLSVNFSAGTLVSISAVAASFTGANQITPCQNTNTLLDFTGTTASLAVTSATNDIPIAMFVRNDGGGSNNGTTIFSSDAPGVADGLYSAYTTGVSSFTFTATAASQVWEAAGLDIASATAAISHRRLLLGVGQ